MSSPASFEAVFASLTLDHATLRRPVEATFMPEQTKKEPGLDSLPLVSLGVDDGMAAELRLGELIGVGGRGEVRLARQVSLRRDVAVKRLKEPSDGAAELLREARATGSLEHPNVVPVYTLGRGASGEVVLVMKRVEGVPWKQLLETEGPARTDAALERHLEIFRQVCNAIEFAHSRGILHRDLKPENVMVGAFGEVVVLDWGLAVSVEPDDERGLLHVERAEGLAGTPAYMAPEQVRGVGRVLGRFTDIYLLGATLHHVLTGAPPHRGDTLEAVLEKAFYSAPQPYDADVPAELAAVCQRAMSADPAQRFENVKALSDAVRDVGRHRQSVALALEAQRLLERATPETLTTVLAQSRFGFQQALRIWPENMAAQRGLQQALLRELRHELDQRNVTNAERLLSQLTSPEPALEAELAALRRVLAAEAEENARLRRYEREFDPDVTTRGRNRFLAIAGLVWTVVPIIGGSWERWFGLHITPAILLGWLVPWMMLALGLGFFLRRELFANRIARRLGAGFAVTVLAAGLIRGIAYAHQAEVHHTLAYELGTYAVITAVSAALFDRRFIVITAAYLLGTLVCTLWPEYGFFAVAGANFIALAPIPFWWDHFDKLQAPPV